MAGAPRPGVPFERPVLTVQEVAELFGVSRWLVQQAAHTGELPCIRLGRRLLFSRARVESLLTGSEARESAGSPPAAVVTDHQDQPENASTYPQIVLGGHDRRAAARR
jgi:excisionase family DNA binding protein